MEMAQEEPFKKFNIITEEQLTNFFSATSLPDLLKFENLVAQVCSLVPLFCESYGSAAELGAFSTQPDIAQKLLLIIEEKNYTAGSFIGLGPVKVMEAVAENAVRVLHPDELNVRPPDFSKLNKPEFKRILESAIDGRVKAIGRSTTFDPKNNGHVIKLCVGALQHYGALTSTELELVLDAFGIKLTDLTLNALLKCAEMVGWIISERRDLTYFLPIVEGQAISYSQKANTGKIDKERWKASIREHWRTEEPDRFAAITRNIPRMAA